MSSRKIEKKKINICFNKDSILMSDLFHRIKDQSYMRILNVSISYSQLFNYKPPNDFYSEKQNIIFEEINPIFKRILKEEFADAITNLEINNQK